MDYVELKCPECGEVMKAPAERESIICMFCGKTIEMNVASEMKEETVQLLKENMKTAFSDIKKDISEFKKDLYADKFQSFTSKNRALLSQIEEILNAGDQGVQVVSDCFVETNKELILTKKSKIDKENWQLNLNMFMAIYMMPAILETRHFRAKALCDKICEQWAQNFKDSKIKSATYEEIAGGFRRKLCYITTAVCKSLNMGEDCMELTLLKDYRDQYLATTENGEELIHRYYDIAPTIVKRINKESDADEKYLFIWNTYLKPCIDYIQQKRMEECAEVYIAMVNRLYVEYMEDNHE